MSPLTICFVTREYPPETGYGGIGTYYAELAHLLTARGYRVIVLSEGLKKESFVDDHGVHIYRVRPRLSVTDLPVIWRLNRFWRGYRLAVATKLHEIVRKYNVNIIETPELHAETFLYHISRLSQPPLVVRMHSGTALALTYNNQPSVPRFRINVVLEKWLLRRAALITSPSQALVDRSRKLGLPVPPNRTRIFPNPVNTDLFSPDETTPREEATILFVGRIEWWKGPDIIIDALPQIAAAIPKIIFRFVGNDEEEDGTSFGQTLMNKVPDALRGCVEFLPAVPRNQLPDLYRRATIAITPSRWESFGYVCAEAMACGTPVIVNNRGGLPEIVGDAGIVVEPENPAALATAIINLMNDPARRQQLSIEGRRRIVDFCGPQRVADEVAQLYEAVAVGHV